MSVEHGSPPILAQGNESALSELSQHYGDKGEMSKLSLASIYIKAVTGKQTATNSNQSPSKLSAANEANEEKQDKGAIGPGEIDQNVEGCGI